MKTCDGPVGVPSMRTLRSRFMTSAVHCPFTIGWLVGKPRSMVTCEPEAPVTAAVSNAE